MVFGIFTFDPTLNAGQLVEITAIVIGGVGGVVQWRRAHSRAEAIKAADKAEAREQARALKAQVTVVNTRVDDVVEEMKKQTDILIRLGEQGARLTSIETQMALLQAQALNK